MSETRSPARPCSWLPSTARSLTALLFAATFLPAAARAQDPAPDEARLLRFPHVRGDKLVFSHGGDLWAGRIEGDRVRARRLTSHDEGFEVFGRISPDGEHVAYSGERFGTRQIELVPFEGGEPRRLTWYPDVGPMPPRGGYDHLPFDWTPDGSHILVRANRTPYGQRVGRFFLVDPTGGSGLEEPLQIPEGGPASFSPDGSKLAFNVISREWRTWKRYTAGRAQDVGIYDLENDTFEEITDFEGTDNWPMWIGNRIYFTSDRGSGTLNLWVHDLASGEQRAITTWDDWDVLFPARGGDRIVFERGGWLWLCDASRAGDERVTRLRVTLGDDRPLRNPTWRGPESAGDGGFTLAPSAEQAVVELRGDLFLVPREHGAARNLTRTPARREMMPTWSPDGLRVAYVAETVAADEDAGGGGDYEVFVRGLRYGEDVQLTKGSEAWPLSLAWDPKSERLALTDKRNRLRVVDRKTRKVVEVDEDPEGGLGDVQWSADGTWLTYTKLTASSLPGVFVARADGKGEARLVTDPDWPATDPSFDPDGRYLYFTSSRSFVYDDSPYFESKLFALLLREDVESPTAPRRSVEPALAGEGSGAKNNGAKQNGDEKNGGGDAPLAIDFDGLEDRLVALPLPAQRGYRGLVGVEGGLLFLEGGTLKRYDLAEREAKTLLEGAGGALALTPDRAQFLYRHQGKLAIAKTQPGQKALEHTLPTDGLRVRVEPPREWAQIYRDAWRLMRDWFYDDNMHHVDWEAMRTKYEPLLAHVSHRADLDFVLGELIGELNAGHTYVQPGEMPRAERVPVGVLGADLAKGGRHYRFAEIFPGENWDPERRNPLREPGVDIEVGDYLIAIDGEEVTVDDDPYRLLEGRVDEPVELTVHDEDSTYGARRVVVHPIANEQPLRYLAWVERNRALVERLSDGRIGYIHAPNTALGGHRAIWEGWRAQARRYEAMIIDDRYNGGGFIPDRMAWHIGRPVFNWWAQRHQQLAPTPDLGFDGPMAMLINGYSSSGGDAFPYYFRAMGRGALIGRTTWGGLVGYSGTPRFVDGGGLAVPGFAFVNKDGMYDVEAYGVAPDIDVFDDPAKIQAGEEPVLEAAVTHLIEQLEAQGAPKRPAVPESPDRSELVTPPPGSSARVGGR
jgi:tricorn protease